MKKITCPDCEQDYIHKLIVSDAVGNWHACSMCFECNDTWSENQAIDIRTGLYYKLYAENLGLNIDWNTVKEVIFEGFGYKILKRKKKYFIYYQGKEISDGELIIHEITFDESEQAKLGDGEAHEVLLAAQARNLLGLS